MFLVNSNNGYVNGTIGKVLKIDDSDIKVQFLDKSGKIKTVYVQNIPGITANIFIMKNQIQSKLR